MELVELEEYAFLLHGPVKGQCVVGQGVLPYLTFVAGARITQRRIQKNLRTQHETKVAMWRGDQLPAIPAIDPGNPASIVDAYGQTVYNAARLSFDAPSAPDQVEHHRQLTQLYAEAERLEAIMKARLATAAGAGVED